MTRTAIQFIASLLVYLLWAFDLYYAHWPRFSGWQTLVPVNGVLGCLGVWILSSRWVRSVGGRWVAGAVYGLGPYCLTMLRFHPMAGLLLALIPWLFCPVFHLDRLARHWGLKTSYQSTLMVLKLLAATLPWAVMIGFFQLSTYLRRFVLPLEVTHSLWRDWPSLLAPCVLALQGRLLLSVYHVPLSLALVGAMVMLKARRWGPVACILAAVLLTFTRGGWQVSPLAWMSIVWVFVAVLCGVGIDALVAAGRGDVRWIAWAPVLQVGLAVVLLLAAGKYFQVLFGDHAARVLFYCARFYLLGAVCLGLMVTLTYRGYRLRWIRWVLILGPVGVDLFFSSQFLVDRLL